MNRLLVASSFAFAAVGCAGAPGSSHTTAAALGPGGGVAAAGSDVAPGVVAPASAMAQRVEQLRTQLGAQGARFRGVAAAGFMTQRANVTTAFDVPAGECVSIIALASSGIRDLDAHLFAPDGDLVVEDVEPDPHPTVQLCATEPRRVYHVLEAFDGQGAYVIASFATDRRGLELIAHAVGGRPGTAMSATATASDAERRLAETRAGIARRGFLPHVDGVRAPFPAAGALRFPFQVTPDRCYTFAAFADGSIADTDLSVYDPDGEEIARDVRPERDAFVQLCPSAAATLAVEIRARPGPGVVLMQPFAADAASLGGANTLWWGERTAWGASATPLAQSQDATRRTMAAQGYTADAAAQATLTFAPGESHESRVTLEGGRCTAIAAVAGRGVGRLSVLVYDASGELVARGTMRGAAAVAVACPPAREAVVVRVRAEVGSGDAALQTFAGAAPPAWAAGIERVALAETLGAQLAAQHDGWRPEGTPERLRVGGRTRRTRELDLAAGTCTRLAVSAGRGLPLLALTLRGAGDQTLLENSADGTATLTRCATAAEHVRLEVAVEPEGPAEYDAVVARFVRPQQPAAGAR